MSSHHRGHPRSDDGNAFLRDSDGGAIDGDGSVGEEMTEDFLRTVTSGEDAGEDVRNQTLTEDYGGPFVISTNGQEIADDVDESNPVDAEVEGMPSPMRGRS